MSKQYPTTIYVARETDGDNEFLVAQEDVADTAERESRDVGVYVLKEVITVSLEVRVNG